MSFFPAPPVFSRISSWGRAVVAFACLVLPVASLVLCAFMWWQYGVNLPVFDDWRAYLTNEVQSLAPSYLFRGVNDTLAPVGFALDALAQRFLHGNAVTYQLLSMLFVLGGLLVLQWRLLRWALQDYQQVAFCFVFTLLMLQPDTYWGSQYLAYHQALPLVFLLWALLLALDTKTVGIMRALCMLSLGLLAGFSYLSGAVASLVMGASMLMLTTRVANSCSPGLRTGGWALALAGIVTVIAQAFFGLGANVGTDQGFERRIALPTQPEFWFFLLGKIGRSLLLPLEYPLLSLALVLAVSATTAACVVFLISRLNRHMSTPTAMQRTSLVFCVLFCVVFAYLLIVTAGRTRLRTQDIASYLQIFEFGFARFHFFWLTLLWPWLAAVLLIIWQRMRAPTGIKQLDWVVPLVGVWLMASGGVFQHQTYFKHIQDMRQTDLQCLRAQVPRGEGIRCPSVLPSWFGSEVPDLSRAFWHAGNLGSTFVKQFPVLPIALGSTDPAPWLQATFAATTGDTLLRTARPTDMARCVTLDVVIAQLPPPADAPILVFHRMAPESEVEVARPEIRADAAPTELVYRVHSDSGFADDLRLQRTDPAVPAQILAEVRCRLFIDDLHQGPKKLPYVMVPAYLQ